MKIFHVATAADWREAQASGRYITSTRGRTLAEEGFIHASRADQWQGVRERFYADVSEPLVLLVIDTDRLTAPVVEEPVSDSEETFPHVYGAIDSKAVVQAIPLESADPDPPPARPATADSVSYAPIPGPTATANPTRTFFSLYLEEFSVRAGLALVTIVVAVLLGLLVVALAGDFPGLVTMLVLLVLGLVVSGAVVRRRDRRIGDKADSGA